MPQNYATHAEDVWRIFGLLFLCTCVIFELIAHLKKLERPKKTLELLGLLFLILYVLTDVIAFSYERKARRIDQDVAKATAEYLNSIFAAGARSLNEESAFINRSRAEAARRSKDQPSVHVWLSPIYIGNVNIVISSSNLVPFRYRYTLTTDGPN